MPGKLMAAVPVTVGEVEMTANGGIVAHDAEGDRSGRADSETGDADDCMLTPAMTTPAR